MKKLLEIQGLKKYFPIYSGFFRKKVGEVKAVDGIDFSLEKGSVLGIVGESGSGKSTLARACIRLIEPTSGSCFYDGKDILKFSKKELFSFRPKVQFVFQDPLASLNPRKTILETIGEGAFYHGIVKTKDEKLAYVTHLLQEVGLSEEALFSYPHEFSGGQQQRIAIGRALSLKPSIVICDEAVSSLDVSVQAQILNLLQSLKLKNDLSYIFISHDLSVIQHISDYVVVMYLGKVMERGNVHDLFQNPKHPYTQSLLSAIPKKHPKEEKNRIILKGDIPSPQNPPSGCPFRTRCPYAQEICKKPPPKKTKEKGHDYFCILD